MKPTLATNAVINTGLNRRAAASMTASRPERPAAAQLVNRADQDDAIEHGDAEQRNESD
jgi:hypothetical protein